MTANVQQLPVQPATAIRCSKCITRYRKHLDAIFNAPTTTHYVPPRKPNYLSNDHDVPAPTFTPLLRNHHVTTSPRSYNKVITCRNPSCTPTTRDLNYHYITYTMPVAITPTCCPSCSTSKHLNTRDYDYPDTIITQHPNMKFNRRIAIRLLSELDKLNSRRDHNHQVTAEDYIRKVTQATNSTPERSQGICPLSVVCKSCGGTYTLIRTTPTAHVPPTYCVWCSSTLLTVQQYNTEETATLVLQNTTIEASFQAMHEAYQIPVALLKVLYDDWSTNSKEPFFASYLQSPDVQLAITTLRGGNK